MLVACGEAPAATAPRASAPPSDSIAPRRALPDAVAPIVVVPNVETAVPSSAPVVPIRECNGPRERLHGTTCCESRGSRDDRFPGQVFLQCRGPNIGKKCTKKGDCDIACSCGDEDPRGGAEDPRAPKDGMLGLTGTCAGQLRVGVWMCQIDEQGKVTHMIVD